MTQYQIGAIHDAVRALNESLNNMADEDVIEAESLTDALIAILKLHPEPLVAKYEADLLNNVEIK